MSKTVTIGGDRLGAGKKMKQTMHGYERSNHDLSYIWRSTMAPGVLVPFLNKVMLPGDTFDISLNTETLTHPTTGPLFGSFKLQLDVFKVPIRLYQAQLHNNKLGIGLDMSKIKLPLTEIRANALDYNSPIPLDLQQFSSSSLLAYLDRRGIGRTNTNTGAAFRSFNAIPYLAYYDIYKNYYANKQEEIGAIIDYQESPVLEITEFYLENYITGERVDGTVVPINYPVRLVIIGENLDIDVLRVTLQDGTDTRTLFINQIINNGREIENDNGVITRVDGIIRTEWIEWNIIQVTANDDAIGVPPPAITTFPLSNLDNMREDILANIKSTAPFLITKETYAPYGNNLMNTNPENTASKIRSYLPMQGLALKTYQSDKFNNWLSTEWIEGTNGIAEITKVDVTDGLNLDTLNLAQKVYNMLNRIAISGGSYYDWIEAVYTESPYNQIETPVYCGGLSKEVIFQEVISNSESGDQPLGTLAGRGRQSDKHKGGEIYVKAEEPCYVMGIVSLTPRLDYSQGNAWEADLYTMDDFHKPALDGIGFQDLITDEMAFWDTNVADSIIVQKSAGKQPAWINYMTDVNRTYGLFADERSEMFMTLNRKYEADPITRGIKDLTTYIDPAKFNYTFAQTDRHAQNFWVQIKCDISARRKVSARQIPNL